VVENLLVRNSNKSGIVFDYSNNVLVRNTVVHNTWVRYFECAVW
jgi:parallel beta-helix repeat protein